MVCSARYDPMLVTPSTGSLQEARAQHPVDNRCCECAPVHECVFQCVQVVFAYHYFLCIFRLISKCPGSTRIVAHSVCCQV